MLGDLLRGKHADFEACRIVLGMKNLSSRSENGTLFDYDGRVLSVSFSDGTKVSLDGDDLADARYEIAALTSNEQEATP